MHPFGFNSKFIHEWLNPDNYKSLAENFLEYCKKKHIPEEFINNYYIHSCCICANDVAMTVLPNAPIDDATGLPVPTIAVATDGGVSVIKDDGNVVDIRRTSDDDVHHVDFDGNKVIMFHGVGAIYVATMSCILTKRS